MSDDKKLAPVPAPQTGDTKLDAKDVRGKFEDAIKTLEGVTKAVQRSSTAIKRALESKDFGENVKVQLLAAQKEVKAVEDDLSGTEAKVQEALELCTQANIKIAEALAPGVIGTIKRGSRRSMTLWVLGLVLGPILSISVSIAGSRLKDRFQNGPLHTSPSSASGSPIGIERQNADPAPSPNPLSEYEAIIAALKERPPEDESADKNFIETVGQIVGAKDELASNQLNEQLVQAHDILANRKGAATHRFRAHYDFVDNQRSWAGLSWKELAEVAERYAEALKRFEIAANYYLLAAAAWMEAKEFDSARRCLAGAKEGESRFVPLLRPVLQSSRNVAEAAIHFEAEISRAEMLSKCPIAIVNAASLRGAYSDEPVATLGDLVASKLTGYPVKSRLRLPMNLDRTTLRVRDASCAAIGRELSRKTELFGTGATVNVDPIEHILSSSNLQSIDRLEKDVGVRFKILVLLGDEARNHNLRPRR